MSTLISGKHWITGYEWPNRNPYPKLTTSVDACDRLVKFRCGPCITKYRAADHKTYGRCKHGPHMCGSCRRRFSRRKRAACLTCTRIPQISERQINRNDSMYGMSWRSDYAFCGSCFEHAYAVAEESIVRVLLS